jgi:aspartyl-tRNA(Asn)/glutamyl-tRNA(Gln) amidotransferase subunit A
MSETYDAKLASDCAAVLSGTDVKGLRVGIPSSWFNEVCDAAVLENWHAAVDVLASLGCTLVTLPPMDIEPFHDAGWVILQSELAAYHAERVNETDLMDPGMLHRLKNGLNFSALDYTRALQMRSPAQDMLLASMDDVDVMVTPGIGGEAGFLDSLTVQVDDEMLSFQSLIPRNTMMFDLTGFPALMLPSGLGRCGMPTGMQIVARPGADALCLRAGAAFQGATQHHRLTPPGQGQG